MKLRPRLIPSVILAATLLLGLKVSDIFSFGTHALAEGPSSNQATGAPLDLTSQANAAKAPASPARAKPSEPPASKQAQASAPPQQAAAAQEAAAKAPSSPAESAAKPAAAAAVAKPEGNAKPDAPNAETAKPEAAKPGTQTAAAPAASDGAPSEDGALKDPLLLSPEEIQILQELSQRRTQLDKRASELDQQQVVLQAAEKRIDEKIAKLEALQKSIQVTVDKQAAADDARTQSLVKIYETMKPGDAAQILSQLNMPDLLLMLGHMKEAKTAPILAAMDPAKAQAITAAMMQKDTAPTPVPVAATAKP